MKDLTAVVVMALCGLGSTGNCQETRAEFPQPYNTQELSLPLLDPQQALERLHLPEGFQAALFAAEPDVQQPIAMAFDSRGRLWIAENYTYAESKLTNDMSLRDRIIILEDVDQDGHFDQRTVFWDEAQRLTSIEIGFGGVWALCPPNLLFIPDRNGDDVPDAQPQVILDGWRGDSSRHNFVNGLRWGPDGWLYGRHGITDTSAVGAPGTPAGGRVQVSCSIWRYHPTGQEFEVVCNGTTNPWGTDWDDYGQLFFINTVIGHLWHVVPGAHYKRMYGEDFNPHLYELIDQTADHFHWDTAEQWSDLKKTGMTKTSDQAGGGHAHCGMMIYLGDNWPAQYRGDVLALNLHGRRANRDKLERHGATYVGRHRPDLLHSDDVWFRGIDLTYGPDGGVIILDWSDIDECHERDGVHRTSGRIFKVTYGRPPATSIGDVAKLGNEALVQLQLHENDWYVRQARRELQQRAVAGVDLSAAKTELLRLYNQQSDVRRKLRAMWCLYCIDAANSEWLTHQLTHPSEHIRLWAVKLLVDRGSPGDSVARALIDQADNESSGLVLTFLASALQRLEPSRALELARRLLAHAEFADDPVLPLMVWYGVEPLAAQRPLQAVELIPVSRMPQVTRFLARRLMYGLEQWPRATDRLVQLLGARSDVDFRRAVLQGMSDALRGLRQAKAPAKWGSVSRQLGQGPAADIRALARGLSVVFGDGRAAEELKSVALNTTLDFESRRQAIATLVDVRTPGTGKMLEQLLPNRDLGPAAVRGLVALGDPKTPQILLAEYGNVHYSVRSSVVEALASRRDFAGQLLDAVQSGQVKRETVTPFLLRQIQLLSDDQLNSRIEALWPELRLIATDKLQVIANYREQLAADRLSQADLGKGRKLFEKSCGKCHKLFGQGGAIGPELTGAQRTNLNYLLENIVDPSATLAANYRMSIVLLDDGRAVNGVIGQQTAKTISVQTPTEKLILDRKTIDEIRPSQLSLMPDGLLNVLQQEQVRDLIGYLMSAAQQVRAGDEKTGS